MTIFRIQEREREFFIDNLLVRIHFIIEMILVDHTSSTLSQDDFQVSRDTLECHRFLKWKNIATCFHKSCFDSFPVKEPHESNLHMH